MAKGGYTLVLSKHSLLSDLWIWLGYPETFHFFCFNISVADLLECVYGHPEDILWKTFWYNTEHIVSSMMASCAGLKTANQPQNIILPQLCLTAGMGWMQRFVVTKSKGSLLQSKFCLLIGPQNVFSHSHGLRHIWVRKKCSSCRALASSMLSCLIVKKSH